jgi:hypothetical protein
VGAAATTAYASAAGAARQAFAGGGASLGTGTGLPDQTWWGLGLNKLNAVVTAVVTLGKRLVSTLEPIEAVSRGGAGVPPTSRGHGHAPGRHP